MSSPKLILRKHQVFSNIFHRLQICARIADTRTLPLPLAPKIKIQIYSLDVSREASLICSVHLLRLFIAFLTPFDVKQKKWVI
jgi:hypothetical protein